MPSRFLRTTRRCATAPLAASIVLLAGAAPALADDATYTVELRQELPTTATSGSGGVPQESRSGCPGVPDGKDGWHFVLPGNSSEFVELDVTFEPGGRQVITDFGPPSAKHAYAASEPGAELVDVSAQVQGGELELFNLSHTCPADTAPDNPGEEPTDEPTEESTDEPTDEPTSEPSDEPAPDGSDSPETQPEPTVSASGSPAVAGGQIGDDSPEGDLATTGSSAPVGALAAGAAVLVGAGGYLVMRRRKAARQD
ncbi:LPXTG cell wall anchor domain-containing protein [Streptomyces sp. TR06-5]|uniref:LPXTG cell wall anchor domain-containing protein n=1 Tax=unclassified Streptomyces TaxID=2593676 RepID=UPI0039A11D20